MALVEPQPHSRPCSAMISSGTRKMARAIAPGQSMRRLLLVCGRLSTLATTNSATAPIGTLTRKIQRQPSMPAMVAWPDSTPPMTGPMTLEVPNTARM